MLIGRDAERARLRTLLEAARAGRGGVVVLRGEAGIGKTALLADLRARAGGFRVLAARGAESETGLAFAGLADLLRPVLDRIAGLPGAQRAALEAALALGPPAVPDRFAAYSAALGLLSGLARERPVLLVVDDAQWLDVPSREALLFCARRIGDDAVLLLAASREEPPEGAELAGLEELRPAPLDDDAARRLLDAVEPDLAPAVRDELVRAAAGIPLALRELPRALTPGQRAGREPLPRTPPVGEALLRAYRARIESAGPAARRAALVAAVSEDGDLATVTAALEARGGDRDDLQAAEAAGLVGLEDDAVGAAHPLLRSALLQLAEPAERREAHRALAEAIGAERAEQRAWHLAEAAVAPDEAAAAALEQAAALAAARTGYAAAADALHRASRLGAPEAAGARRLAAAQMAMAAGAFDRSTALLDGVPGPQAAHLRGIVTMLAGRLDTAFGILVEGAARAAPSDPLTAASMLADAVLTRTMAGDCHAALHTARRAYTLAGERLEMAPAVAGYLAGALVLRGFARQARPVIERLDALTSDVDPTSPASHMMVVWATWRPWIGDFEQTAARVDAWLDRGRAASSVGFLALPLVTSCELDFRMGRWPRALARGTEALAMLAETGQRAPLGYVMATLALVEAATGRTADAQRHAQEARALGRRDGVASVETYSAAALGFLALASGDPETARRELEPLRAHTTRWGLAEPAAVLWQPDLIESCARLGMRLEARRALATLAEQAHRTGGRWARAVTCRCRGLIDDDIDRHFGEALALHEDLPMPFERARTQLAYGARLRRAGRRLEARSRLEQALAAFEELGAQPWARQAREEMAAGGGRLRPRTAGAPSDELSPRELQVALAVAEGATNREAAARLFLSEKTIERHLGSVYRKLGLRSRSELARRFARAEDQANAGSGGAEAISAGSQ
ncbi:AAA family ATPase [Miltoncostaea marina]|uniref:AAA family ATPase n=1 Tax=Miltoncostaea marina TaxID=2843215 RepID=UPI001C3D9696|nr:LuxR family transcriptional regulator [Miltoncostaea marina]